jgi:Alpha galactosidase C-terminal beta sandwich domain
LVLSHDVNDDAITDQIWTLISNREVLEVNQVYVGDSGGVYWQSEDRINLGGGDYRGGSETNDVIAPVTQLLAKPLTQGRVAVLAMNHGMTRQSITVRFETVPGLTCDPCLVRDIWAHQTIGTVSSEITLDVDSHDSAFIVMAPGIAIGNRFRWSNISFVPTLFLMCLVVLWILLRTKPQCWRMQFRLCLVE